MIQTGELPDRLARLLGCQIPQRTIHRVARAATWQQLTQLPPIDAAFDLGAMSLQRRGDLIGRVLEVINARCLATTEV